MVFSSIYFLFYFFPLFFIVYYLLPKVFKNKFILAASVLFYAWGAPKFIFVLLGTTVIDFFVVRWMHNQQQKSRKTLLLCVSLMLNLGLLFYFKYSNFFIENINVVLNQLGLHTVKWAEIVLPIGISFYTFETITYVVDVYRGVHKPLKNFWDYQLYIILFPKLIAGPIIRFHDIADQIYNHTENETIDNKLKGFYRFFIGLGKKVLIANVMGAAVEKIFAIPSGELSTSYAWLGALSYTFQIYFDFSGYSDMAIGLGLMMGFKFPENFNNPYTATSITDFWRKWHITLGSWMRNYLYIPLGGNKASSQYRVYLNLWIVFLASGLWHGAAWGFIIWGAYHGFFLIIERIFLNKWLTKLGRFSFIYTFPVVVIGWVFFKIEQLQPSIAYIKTMFSNAQSDLSKYWQPDKQYLYTLCLAFLFSFFTITQLGKKIQDIVYYKHFGIKLHFAMMFSCIVLLLLVAGKITVSTFNPFIYFRF